MAAYMQRMCSYNSHRLLGKKRIFLFSHPVSTLIQTRQVHQLYSHRLSRTKSNYIKPTGVALCYNPLYEQNTQLLQPGVSVSRGVYPQLRTGLDLSVSALRFCHSQSGGEPKPGTNSQSGGEPKPGANSQSGGEPSRGADPHAAGRRQRLLTYLGAFVVLHLCVLWGRRYYKNQDKTGVPGAKPGSPPAVTEGADYVDPDLGKSAKMFHHRGYLLPHFAKESLKAIEELPVRDGDVFVSSFPKSGTTWVQELVYQILHVDDKSDTPGGNMEERFPYLEFLYPGVKEIRRQDGPRLIKTHLPHALLPTQAAAGRGKVIYVARNPKDVSVSYYHYVRMLAEVHFNGNYQSFFDKFINDKVAYGPWWRHVLEYWQHREDTNLLFVTYEQLQQDLEGSIQRVARFLGRDLTPGQVAQVAGRCSFTAMTRNPDTNYSWWEPLALRRPGETRFMRKGVVGDWRNYCTSDMVQKMDAMTKERLAPAGLHLPDHIDNTHK